MARTTTKAKSTRPVRKAAKKPRAKAASETTAKAETKQSIVLVMLRRSSGASIAEIIDATDWQPHSVRGFFAGALKKRLGLDVTSEKDSKTGERRYSVAALKA